MSGSRNGLIARYPTLAVGLTCIDKQNNAAGIHLPKSVGQYSGAEATIGRLVGHSRDSVTGRYIDAVDTLLVMAADTVAGFIKGPVEGTSFRRSSYALDRRSREATLAQLFEQSVAPA